MTNEEKYKEYKKKKLIKYLVILLCFATITLEAFALFQVISFAWGLGTFALLYLVKYFFVNADIKKDNKKKDNKEKSKNKK